MEVQPDTGKVIPDANGMGPTNANNLVTSTTAKDLQKQADQTAVSENRAGTPSSGASDIAQNPITYKGNFKNKSIDAATRMFGNVSNPVPSPSQFNSGLRKASAEGELDSNPSFKAKVDAAPPINYNSPAKAIPVGAIIKGVQAVGALKSAAQAKGDPKPKFNPPVGSDGKSFDFEYQKKRSSPEGKEAERQEMLRFRQYEKEEAIKKAIDNSTKPQINFELPQESGVAPLDENEEFVE